MNILEIVVLLLFFGIVIFSCFYCCYCESKRQKRFEERQERFVVALEELRDYFYFWHNT